MKRLMILGGSQYIVPVILSAQAAGHYVITCDYIPTNKAHQFSDQYLNLSILNREAVLKAATDLKIDGIISFAADPGVLTAAYIAEEMGLPFQGPYSSIKILQNKDLFRTFLMENGFETPRAFLLEGEDTPRELLGTSHYPLIVKPTDSAGSKGVRRVDMPSELADAIAYAKSFSPSGKCIAEEFIEKEGESSDSDCFLVDGKFKCISFSDQLFGNDLENPYVPAGYVMPSSMPVAGQELIEEQLQRLSDLLELQSGIFNVETRIDGDGRAYIMEVSPRGGGNRLAEMLNMASGVDLIGGCIAAALGEPIPEVVTPVYDSYLYQLILHSEHSGVFKGVEMSVDFERNCVIDKSLWVGLDHPVKRFSSANFALGSIILKFSNRADLEAFKRDPGSHIRVVVEKDLA